MRENSSFDLSSAAPVASRRPVVRTHHGDSFTDDYQWMREKDSPELLAYLEEENAYTKTVSSPQEQLRESIFSEIKAHTQETDLSVPSRRDGYWYFTRTVEGSQYGIQCRIRATSTGHAVSDWTPPVVEGTEPLPGEETILDGNKLAEGEKFFALGGLDVSEDGRFLAYSVDSTGDERYTVLIKDLSTGELLPDRIEGAMAGHLLSPDASAIYYLIPDESWRPYRIYRHQVGESSETDQLIFEETDPTLWSDVGLSSDRRELVIDVGNSELSEIHVLPLESAATEKPRCLISRHEKMLASADPLLIQGRPHYLITHNRDGANNSVSLVDAEQFSLPLAQQNWRTVIAHDPEAKIDGTAISERWISVAERRNTTPGFLTFSRQDLEHLHERPIRPLRPSFSEELYAAAATSSYESPLLTLHYVSFTTPSQVLLWDPSTSTLDLLKQAPVPGVDLDAYEAIRDWTTAADGTRIPLSIIKRKDTLRDGSAAAIIYGYGSYEASMDPRFSVARLSVLDRGAIWVVAHVRGGGELGREWYTQGKKLKKLNTFTDFIAASEHVGDAGWASPDRLAAIGGSAGGLLMGAVINMAPALYQGVVAVVPFVDALTTILDPELPLSALEWEEWGNPLEDPEVYAYMKSYSPYENVPSTRLPAIAAVTSLHDTRVLYVEPAKWVAKLRLAQQGTAPLVLRTEMEGGHGGGSGRYTAWKDLAWEYAWALSSIGATQRSTEN